MKLLDEKGLETVWATCKVKFALAGHTHKLSQLTNDKGFVTGSVIGNTITINGVSTTWSNTWRGIQDNLLSTSTSDSLSANQGKILKGLIDSKANSSDLSSYAKKSQAIASIDIIEDYYSDQKHTAPRFHIERADGDETTLDIGDASTEKSGLMSCYDKKKLDGIDANIGKFNSANAIERCVYGRINFMTPLGDVNLDNISHKDGIIIFANLTSASNITCSEGFVYNDDYIDNNKRVEPGRFLITVDGGVPVVLSL